MYHSGRYGLNGSYAATALAPLANACPLIPGASGLSVGPSVGGLLIFLLVPEAATQRHLEILSEIAEMLSDRELRERLKTEVQPAEVHRMIAAWEPLKSVA